MHFLCAQSDNNCYNPAVFEIVFGCTSISDVIFAFVLLSLLVICETKEKNKCFVREVIVSLEIRIKTTRCVQFVCDISFYCYYNVSIKVKSSFENEKNQIFNSIDVILFC